MTHYDDRGDDSDRYREQASEDVPTGVRLDTSSLTPMQLGRVNASLDKRARYAGEVRTLREHLATLEGVKTEGDGFIDWNRRRFNAMTAKEQQAYEARLKARRYYYVDGWQVPKIIFDLIPDVSDQLRAAIDRQTRLEASQ